MARVLAFTVIVVLLNPPQSFGQARQSPGQIPGAQFPVPSPFNQRSTPEQDVAQAKKLEQLGEIEQAIALYERALQKSPTNAQALNALPRLYIQTQNYDRAVTLLDEQVRRSPDNTVFRRQLADALFQAKRPDEARRQLQTILSLAPAEDGTIRMVAALYTSYGQYIDAVQTYTGGRKATGKPDLFAQQLAALYTTMADAPNAVGEYARWLNSQPGQFAVIDDHIDALTYIGTPETIGQALLKATETFPASKEINRLTGNFYLRQEKPAEALARYRKADQLDGSKGMLLLEFAAWAGQEEYYTEAVNAYMELRNPAMSPSVQARAGIGLARTYRTTGKTDEAMTVFQDMAARFPKSREYEEALFSLAELQLTYRHEAQVALNGFRNLLSAAPRTAFREAALFRIADCHLARNSVQDAIDQYNRILDPGSGLPGVLAQARAKFHLAEMTLFRGQLNEALDQFAAVASAYPGSQYANDALHWSLLLSDARRDGDEAAQTYVRAVFLRRQFKKQEALDGLKSLLSNFPETPVADLVILDIGALLDDLQKPYEAIAAFRDMIQRYPDSKYGPDAHRRIAELYELRLKDIPKALTEYETALIDYPDHYQNDAIRRKIRQLARQHLPTP